MFRLYLCFSNPKRIVYLLFPSENLLSVLNPLTYKVESSFSI